MKNKLYLTTARPDRMRLVHLEPTKDGQGYRAKCGKFLGRFRIWHKLPPGTEICLACVKAYPRTLVQFKTEATTPGQIWQVGHEEWLFDGQAWRGPFPFFQETQPAPREKVGMKLRASDVLRIRELYASGKFTERTLAARFNVAAPTIHAILKRTLWRNI